MSNCWHKTHMAILPTPTSQASKTSRLFVSDAGWREVGKAETTYDGPRW